MRDHGVLYPNMYDGYNSLSQALSIRKALGLPTDKLYALGLKSANVTAAGLAQLATDIAAWKKVMSQYGYGDLYIYGVDEITGLAWSAQLAALQAVHNAGAKNFDGCDNTALTYAGALLDLAILNASVSGFQPTQVAKWHALGSKAFIYGNPQGGTENADLYRRNYGIALVCNGYDGVMDFAYQMQFGNIWNDFDDPNHKFRDEVFAYPTSNGIIDTIEWEGFRAAVDDVRYLTTLAKTSGVSTYQSVCSSFVQNADLNSLRQTIINRMLSATPGN